IRFHSLIRFPDLLLGNKEWLCLTHRLLPLLVGSLNFGSIAQPLRSILFPGLLHYYELPRPRRLTSLRFIAFYARAGALGERRFRTSRMGGWPNKRVYSRLNWLALSYPTSKATVAASTSSASIRARAACSRICFWY